EIGDAAHHFPDCARFRFRRDFGVAAGRRRLPEQGHQLPPARCAHRRAAPAPTETVVEHGSLKLEAERMRVSWNDVEVPLTVTEFWMVHTLVRFPGHVKNRDQLMRDAELVVDDATITSHIKRIRKKFLAVDPGFDAIETVHGVGYRWKP